MNHAHCDRLFGACTLAAVAAGCSGTSSLPVSHAAASASATRTHASSASGDACTTFETSFDELAACERANGTLASLRNPNVNWRVRYFVRYREMPCNEAPTVDESYVFHMVMNDLNDDEDLTPPQRLAIRDAMYQGTPTCS